MATDEQIADALAGADGQNVSYTLTYEKRSNAFVFLDDMTPSVVSGPKIDGNNNRATFRTAQGLRIRASQLPVGFDIDTDNVAIIKHLLVGVEVVDIPLGLYRLTASESEFDEDGEEFIDCTGADLTSVLLQGSTSATYTVAAATNYMTAVAAILTARGLSHNLPSVGFVTPLDHSWDQGTNWWQIIKDLLEGIAYWPVTPNARGVFGTSPMPVDPSTQVAAVTYTDVAEPRMISAATPWTRKRVLGQFKNVAVAKLEDVRATLTHKQSTNSDGNSAISTASQPASTITIDGSTQADIGRPTTKCILNAATAGDLCAFLLRQEAGKAQVGNISTFRDPRREAHESYNLNIGDVEAATLWLVEDWSMDYSHTNGEMSHSVRRSAPVVITVNV